MRQITLLSAIVGSVLVLIAGCTGSPSQEQHKAYSPHIDPAHFTTKIDNEYFPMKPAPPSYTWGKEGRRDERHPPNQEGDGGAVRRSG